MNTFFQLNISKHTKKQYSEIHIIFLIDKKINSIKLIKLMQKYNINLIDILSPEFQNLKIVHLLIEAFQLRVQCEQIYEKSLVKVAQKFSSITKKQEVYSILTNEMGRIHSERAFQINHFKQEMKAQIAILKNIQKEVQLELDNKSKEFKKIQKDFKLNYQKIQKSRLKTYQANKQLDEKIILNEIGKLNRQHTEQGKKKLFEASGKILAQQKQIFAAHSSIVNNLVMNLEAFNKQIPNISKDIYNIASKLRNQYFDILKKYTIHEVSLLRNIQYDVDGTIKRIQKQELKQIKPIIIQKIPQFVEVKDQDNWDEVRMQVLLQQPNKVQQINQKLKQYFDQAILKDSEQALKILSQKIQKEYQNLRSSILKCIQTYRLENKFKFEEKQYERLVEIFKKINNVAYRQKDMQCLQKILLFSITYYKIQKSQKRFLIEQLKSFKFYSLVEFWKFYCYFNLRFTINNYRKNTNQNNSQSLLHEKNSIYSTLLTCSTNMIQFGVQKHSTKNFLAKAAKSYPLSEFQISQILKFIQNQFNASEQAKKNKETEQVKVLRMGK